MCLICVADQSYYLSLALDRPARQAERGRECWMAPRVSRQMKIDRFG